jgi:hypothetical protein
MITMVDLSFIQDLASRTYIGQSIRNNDIATKEENEELLRIKHALEEISAHFKDKFDQDYGSFKIAKNANPLNRHGKMRDVWSGIYKGASKKHFSAQISFVINVNELCLDVGFYFGIGNAPDITQAERISFQARIRQLGILLKDQIINSPSLNRKYYEAFEFGFKSYHIKTLLTSDEWLKQITIDPADCRIICKVFPINNIISIDAIDLLVDMVISFMDAIPPDGVNTLPSKRKIRPLTIEERVEQAKRLKEIGDKGEDFALLWERDRLRTCGSNFEPIHRAKMSDSYHYDVESRDGNEALYIEVKTTVLKKKDTLSNRFHISADEYSFYTNNPEKYRLYRIYDIEGTPSLEIVEMDRVEILANSYNAIIRSIGYTDKQIASNLL